MLHRVAALTDAATALTVYYPLETESSAISRGRRMIHYPLITGCRNLLAGYSSRPPKAAAQSAHLVPDEPVALFAQRLLRQSGVKRDFHHFAAAVAMDSDEQRRSFALCVVFLAEVAAALPSE